MSVPREILLNLLENLDNIWQAELQAAYGAKAPDARYTTEGRGKSGTVLREVYIARREVLNRVYPAPNVLTTLQK